MKVFNALLSGIAGALTLTLLHEVARRFIPDAPRMDILGMRAIARSMRGLEQTPPSGEQLHRTALAGDLVSNSLYYSLVGLAGERKRAWLAGAILGLVAGIGGVILPAQLGLGSAPSGRTRATRS